MASTFRIPKAPITGVYGKLMTLYAKRKLGGEFPDNGYVYFHNQPVLKAVLGFEQKVEKWDALDANLKSYAQLASAAVIGCSWCLDFGYFLAHNEGLDLDKVREVPRWRESDVFTPLERDVLEYAEAMSVTPLTVTDELVDAAARAARSPGGRGADPDDRAGEHAVAVQLGCRTGEPGVLRRVRAAPRRTVDRMTGRSDAQSATDVFVAHRNLLFTVAYEMLGSAADAEDVLQETWLRWAGRRPGRGARPARLPGPDHHPAVPQPDPHAVPAAGVVRRPVAARAAAHRPGRGRGRRARRQRLDRDADGARDPRPDRAGGVRAA